MKLNYPWLFLAAMCVGACADKNDGVGVETNLPQASPVLSEDEGDEPLTLRTSPSMMHMHTHAEQLDRLRRALDAGDVEAAGTPAYWLAKHETVDGLPDELLPYVDRMREAALIIERTHDLAVARAAAARLETSCEDCHRAIDN